ncbi:glycoside hydrolase family 3 protein [Paenibacillus sedimenti]|uniref:beta-N-acetylhexosaminidase n=1 Tax=Paenibacillus sedimenti TaxID=2770274 RepID=A0A926KVA3_9BACL|nr:glycoside hydrolase family 3 protein [Paenibacillus sedimenti]MBD0382769.1 glycoside hydrolase family 3 protein [Paenibacillus sedimenti]
MINLKAKPFNLNDEAVQWVNETLQGLSLEEKAGQLFITVDLPFDTGAKPDLLGIRPGGVHVFGFSPHANKQHQAALIRDLQKRSKVPLLVSGDLENGGQGGANDGTNLASNMQLAAANDANLAAAFGAAIEAEGYAMGFNWVYGPVVDINYNCQNPIVNIRAFGDTPDVVERTALPVMEAIQKNNRMAACVKHWPGDGMDDRDQHKVLTINTLSMKEWRETYGRVYKSAFENGVKTVMSAHIALPSYYEELGITDVRTKHTPGSLSHELNTKLLREELGFNGLIVSDATSMIGMTSFGRRKDIIPQCIASGVDMFLFTNDMHDDFQAMLQGVHDGVLTEERLDEAVTRILALKASLGLHLTQEEERELDAVGSAAHLQLAEDIAVKSVTLVKDTQGLLPLTPEKQKRILLLAASDEASFFADKAATGDEFARILSEEGFNVLREYEVKEENNEIDAVVFLVQKSPGFMQNSMRLSPHETGGIFKWYPIQVPTVFISLGNPYTLYELPSMPTMINAYNATLAVQKAIVHCLVGKQPFRGESPVDAFCGLEWARL